MRSFPSLIAGITWVERTENVRLPYHKAIQRIAMSDVKESDQIESRNVHGLALVLGGALYVVGSVLFLPQLSQYADISAWCFVVGSTPYLIVAVIEAFASKGRAEFTISATSALAAACFLVGSVFFLSYVAIFPIGSGMFLFGCLLLTIGNVTGLLCLAGSSRMLIMVDLSFLVGSTIFIIASIPYMFDFQAAANNIQISTFLASLYIVGSFFFLLAGGFRHAYDGAFIVVPSKYQFGIES
jgi:hypothetical protein